MAIEIVSNRCFGRSFKRLKKTEDWDSEPIDQNTLPDERLVRDMVERIVVAGLHSLSMEIESKEGTTNTITHAADSTTKKSVGKFAVFWGSTLTRMLLFHCQLFQLQAKREKRSLHRQH